LPAGVFNVVTGPASTAAGLVSHPGIDKIAFTGSTATGALVAAAILTYDDLDEAVRIANGTRYGLSAAIFTADPRLGAALTGRLRAGTVSINRAKSLDDGLPAGGWKGSGYGREYGLDGLLEYLETKTVYW
jgi:acyl-CoA reductase-like NAD-dependent aldehyde dehydrogenase